MYEGRSSWWQQELTGQPAGPEIYVTASLTLQSRNRQVPTCPSICLPT